MFRKTSLFTTIILGVTMMIASGPAEATLAKATFAGGCFWCMEPPYEKLEGVKEVISGYTGGHKKDPTYKEVTAGDTGHLESVEVIYDTLKVTYEQLLDVFWRQIDPTDDGGQFVDRGPSYLSAIFFHDEEQKRLAERSKADIESSGRFNKPIVTPIRPAGPFYRAEEYHQDYYKKNPVRYKLYRFNAGRDRFLEKVWSQEITQSSSGQRWENFMKPSQEELKKKLTTLQYEVTQKEGTEPPFRNEYNNNKREGIYVDIVSGEPLFSSTDKFDSGTGWPSFTRPLHPGNIVEREDKNLWTVRTEVRSKHGDSHLGHVFNDGPRPTGLRYCINSASLRFIKKEDLENEGYGEYLKLFEK